MRLLCESHWSFARERSLVREVRDLIEAESLDLHDLRSDLDLNRTLVCMSGDASALIDVLQRVAGLAFPSIDLTRHIGAHSRTGALDECAFVVPADEPNESDLQQAHGAAERLAAAISASHQLPVFLQDKTGRHADSRLQSLREGGFGSLIDAELRPDFGPNRADPHLGIALIGVRDFWLTLDVRLGTLDLSAARGISSDVPQKRATGDERLLGVEAEAYRLPSREECSVRLALTLPDLTPVDSVVGWAIEAASIVGVSYRATEVVGAIRSKDVPNAERARFREEQIAW